MKVGTRKIVKLVHAHGSCRMTVPKAFVTAMHLEDFVVLRVDGRKIMIQPAKVVLG